MERNDESPSFYSRRGCSLFLMIVTVVIFGVIFGLYFWVDTGCVAGANDWLDDYPGATFIRQEHSFLRPFGIGLTTRIVHSDHTIDTVEDWYISNDLARYRNGMSRADGAAWMRWFTEEADDGGTIIILQSDCAKQWALWKN